MKLRIRLFILRFAIIAVLFICGTTKIAHTEVHDPLDPFDSFLDSEENSKDDDDKSVDQLINESEALLEKNNLQPLNARTKLLKALQKDPKDFRIYLDLSQYYLFQVGHFRLALKYAKQAQALFTDKYGQPPYSDRRTETYHASILGAISQIRLDLDNYKGALETLDEFSSYGYYTSWYAGSRAWVLMKLGKLEEAIKVARLGLIAGSNIGQTLNMLGILLSMNDDKEQSIKVLENAVDFENSRGEDGNPATPLVNMGEVYNEMFREQKAEEKYLLATDKPDGCEHVLPALDLSLLYMEQTVYGGAKGAMDKFESCVAQYPLRNGEEHRALVHFARGRIALHTGHIVDAVNHLEAAREDTQWFGKIGANQDDLKVAATISEAQALKARNNQLAFTLFSSIKEYALSFKKRILNRIKYSWLMSRARRMLVEDLNNFEDLNIRNTDSLIEYSSLGDLIAGFPTGKLEKQIEIAMQKDSRPEARAYYKEYLAANYLAHGDTEHADVVVTEVLASLRPRFDDGLRINALVVKLATLNPGSKEYNDLATTLFIASRAHLRNYGFRLPVNFSGDSEKLKRALEKSAFMISNDQELDSGVNGTFADGKYTLQFNSTSHSANQVRVTGTQIEDVVNQFADKVFAMDLQ